MPSGEDQRSPDGRWEIQWRIDKDFNAYFESETSWEITVRNTARQDVFDVFYYSEFKNSEHWTYSGVSRLEFTPDSSALIATYTDGRVNTIALPPPKAAE